MSFPSSLLCPSVKFYGYLQVDAIHFKFITRFFLRGGVTVSGILKFSLFTYTYTHTGLSFSVRFLVFK